MNQITILLASCVLLCGALTGAAEQLTELPSSEPDVQLPQIEGHAKTIQKAREISKLRYYFEVEQPMLRGFGVSNDGPVLFNRGRFPGLIRRVEHTDNDGKVAVHERPVPRDEALSQAGAMYRKVLGKLVEAHGAGEKSPVPFEFLGIEMEGTVVSDIAPQEERDKAWVKRGYLAKPSDLAALVYLELALIEEKLGREDEYRKLIAQAVGDLKLLEIDYRSDTAFRQHLREFGNFARPECCILFLAAEDARLNGRRGEAQQYYTTLIERAPGSPFAWEALAKMSVMPDTDPKEIDRLKQLLLDTYPLIWGCPRPGLELEKEAFAAQLPALLKKAGEEGPTESRIEQ